MLFGFQRCQILGVNQANAAYIAEPQVVAGVRKACAASTTSLQIPEIALQRVTPAAGPHRLYSEVIAPHQTYVNIRVR